MSDLLAGRVFHPQVHRDPRGSVYELLKFPELEGAKAGQVFVTTALPSQSKGHHFHRRKVEWFAVVAGRGEMILKDAATGRTATVAMTEENPTVVKVTPGLAHVLRNTGAAPLVALVYASEVFNPADPDTFEDKIEESRG